MSVSRVAGPPHRGQSTLTQSVAPPRGDVPRGFRSSPSLGGRTTGSWSSGTRHLPACRAVHDRDRGAPEALARDQPVAQPVVGGRAPVLALGQDLDDRLDGLGLAQTVQRTAVHQLAVARGRHAGLRRVGAGVAVPVLDVQDHANRQVERPCEIQVALVVGGNGHDGAVAVVGQDVVGGVHRQPFAVHGVDRVALQEDARLLAIRCQPVDLAGAADLLQVPGELLADGRARGRGQLGRQVGVGGDDEEGRAEQGVGARRVDGHVARRRAVHTLDLEHDVGTRRAPDPVALHGEHPVGPAPFELGHVSQQPVGVVGDAQVPLGQLLLRHRGVAALAQPVDDLLVGQHGLVLRAPVHLARPAVGQPPLVHPQEQPLVPAVVLGVARAQGAVPVEGAGIAAHGRALLGDVLVGPGARVQAPVDRGVLGGKAEGVPANGVHDVEAALHPVPRDDVAQRVRLGVTHVQVAGGVREHVEDVLAWALVVSPPAAEGCQLVPDRQPALLDRREGVAIGLGDRAARLRGACRRVGRDVVLGLGHGRPRLAWLLVAGWA